MELGFGGTFYGISMPCCIHTLQAILCCYLPFHRHDQGYAGHNHLRFHDSGSHTIPNTNHCQSIIRLFCFLFLTPGLFGRLPHLLPPNLFTNRLAFVVLIHKCLLESSLTGGTTYYLPTYYCTYCTTSIGQGTTLTAPPPRYPLLPPLSLSSCPL